jgi:hypothetical protein
MFSTRHSRERACEEFETAVLDCGGASFETRLLGAPQDKARFDLIKERPHPESL